MALPPIKPTTRPSYADTGGYERDVKTPTKATSVNYIPWGTGTPKKSVTPKAVAPNTIPDLPPNFISPFSGGNDNDIRNLTAQNTLNIDTSLGFNYGTSGNTYPFDYTGNLTLTPQYSSVSGTPVMNGYIATDPSGNFIGFIDSASAKEMGYGVGSGGDGGGGWYGGGGGGGGGTVSPNVTWSEGYSLDGAPEWWRGMLPSTFDANTEYMTLYNAMIPFLSPEDQMNVGRYLYGLVPTKTREPWGTYNPEMMGSANPPVKITTDITEQFTSSERAQNALQALSSLMEASGRTEEKMGPGYQFLRNLLATMGDYGGGAPGSNERQTRAQYQQLQGAVDPLLSQAGGADLSAFKSLASQLTNPFFSAGSVVPISKNAGGQYVFGRPNPEFYA